MKWLENFRRREEDFGAEQLHNAFLRRRTQSEPPMASNRTACRLRPNPEEEQRRLQEEERMIKRKESNLKNDKLGRKPTQAEIEHINSLLRSQPEGTEIPTAKAEDILMLFYGRNKGLQDRIEGLSEMF